MVAKPTPKVKIVLLLPTNKIRHRLYVKNYSANSVRSYYHLGRYEPSSHSTTSIILVNSASINFSLSKVLLNFQVVWFFEDEPITPGIDLFIETTDTFTSLRIQVNTNDVKEHLSSTIHLLSASSTVSEPTLSCTILNHTQKAVRSQNGLTFVTLIKWTLVCAVKRF